MARYTTLTRLARITEDQWGLVTRRQAECAGISPATVQRLAGESVLERVVQGVYRLAGSPMPDDLELRAAWLQLAPDVPAWERTPRQGVVSHRSAAAVYGLGHLPADRHEFTLPVRRQSRREDVRLHQREVTDSEWISLRGLPVTRPARIAADLLADREDPEAVGHVIADAIRGVYDYPGIFVDALAPHAAKFGLRRHDGIALLGWLLDLVGDSETPEWIADARAQLERSPAAR
jgi:predicted transcriptional regulator of viral defense system